jgi:hypothetical protein
MAVTTIELTNALIGTIVGAADGFITRFEMTAGPQPAWQPDGWFEWPSPHGSFARGGRLVLRDGDGKGRRVLSFNPSTENSAFVTNASLGYSGGLMLESCPAGASFRLDVSDVATAAAASLRAA